LGKHISIYMKCSTIIYVLGTIEEWETMGTENNKT
jgi:hypothetical protein